MMRNCAPENLEIQGLVLTHHHGMTAQTHSAACLLSLKYAR
jgi:hypothetical protein